MKKLVFAQIIALLAFLTSCISARVIKQSDSDAIIQGMGVTKVEARISAEEKAKSIFPSYAVKKEPDCSQEYSVDKTDGNTYWSCVLEVQKK